MTALRRDGHQQQQQQDEEDQDDDDDDDNGATDEHEPIFHLPPPPENTYSNEVELEKAIHAWSLEHGYELVRRASKKNARGLLYKRYYHCAKHGQRSSSYKVSEENRQRVNRKSNRLGCPMSIACVAVDPGDPEGQWQIRHRKTHHNHGPDDAKSLAGHRRRARMGGVEKAVDGLFAIGTPTAQVLQFLEKTNPNGLFTRTDVANMKLKWKKWGTCGDKIRRGESAKGNKLGFPSACNACRQKKVGCGSERPVCTVCVQSGSSCIYDHESQQQDDETGGAFDEGDSTQIDLVTPTTTQQQELPKCSSVAPISTPSIRRGRPSAQQTQQTQEILANLQSFTATHVTPTRLTLQSSSVEILAQTSCGSGESYKALPVLFHERDWPAFRDAMLDAARKENTYDVLMGDKREPSKPVKKAGSSEHGDVEEWNEYIKQLAIYNRRNGILLAALNKTISPHFKPRIQNLQTASKIWAALEALCAPRGSEQAFTIYRDLHSVTFTNCNHDLAEFIARLQGAYDSFKMLKLNTSPTSTSYQNRRVTDGSNAPALAKRGEDAVPEEMACFLFLNGLWEEGGAWRRWVDSLCATNNIGGFGTGERLGLRELCKRALGWDEQQRRGG